MSNPSFSFLLPAYKRQYLQAALESILQQSYSNFEVCVSDDASPEHLEDIIKLFDDSRLHYHKNRQNIGAEKLVQHWNTLLSQCNSDYVIIASDDDLYHPSFLEEIVKSIKLNPDLAIYRAAAQIIDHNGRIIKTERLNKSRMSLSEYLNHLLAPNSVLCIGNYVFETIQLKKIGGFVDFPYAWKSDTASGLLLSANGIVCVSSPLFSFRMSDINISSHTGREREKDRAKLKALTEFQEWFSANIEENVLERFHKILKNRLEGEARTYYWALDLKEFVGLYRLFSKDMWFSSFRNRLSFLWGYFRLRVL